MMAARESNDWAVIGGGRWGRVLTGETLRLLPPSSRVILVTERSAEPVQAWLSAQPPELRRRVHVTASLDETLTDPRVEAVLVANRPVLHPQTTQRALAAGKHAFVEKPFTLLPADASELVAEASARGRVLTIGLVYLFASYLHHLRGLAGDVAIRSLVIEWADPTVEFRHGEMKRVDRDISVIEDVFSHIWSIARVLLPSQPMRIRAASLRGSAADLKMETDETTISARVMRDAEERVRRVLIGLHDERSLYLDFSSEPGRPVLDGREIEGCPQWGSAAGPVARELSVFRNAMETGNTPPHDASNCLDSVHLAAEADRLARASAHGA